MLGETDAKLIEEFGLSPFRMKVQKVERTLIDKMFALCDYYMLGRSRRTSRHLYDIYKIAPKVEMNDGFAELVNEVRVQRAQMGEKITPSARPDVDVAGVAERICEEAFYREDYESRTMPLISDDVSHNDVIRYYQEVMKSVFDKRAGKI